MALSFPLSVDDFFSWLPLSNLSFHLPGSFEAAETGGGEIFTAALGTRLWTGTATLGKMSYEEIAKAEVYLSALQRPGATFMAYDRRRPAPGADPAGGLISGVTPQINSLAANNCELSLTNLPASYELQVGDYLSFQYGSNPTRTALHRVVTDTAVADGLGVTGLFEVEPHIRPGATIGTGVSLAPAACKAQIVPDSFDPGSNRRRINEGMKFQFRQTLR